MKIRTRKFTSLLLAGSILATGAAGLGASSALAHDNGGSSTATSQQRDGHRAPAGVTAGRAAVGKAIATTLGMTTAELKAAHKAGTTPAALAQQKGVARDTLVNAVVAALKANKPAGAPTLTDAQLTQRAGNIVDGVHAGRGPGGPGGHRR